jgi:hypothetical protein
MKHHEKQHAKKTTTSVNGKRQLKNQWKINMQRKQQSASMEKYK